MQIQDDLKVRQVKFKGRRSGDAINRSLPYHKTRFAYIVGARLALALVLAFYIVLSLTGFPLSVAHAQSRDTSGEIAGRLLNGTNNNAPVANQTVTLQVAQGSSAQDQASVTTDAQGNYAFPNLSTDKAINYAIYTRYQSAQYVSDLLNLNSKPVIQVDLTVYDATTDSSNSAVVLLQILIHEPDAKKGTVAVSELYVFKNLDNRTYVGSLDASQGKPNALLFALPHGARNISLGQGFNGYKAIAIDSGFATDAALVPGLNELAFSFEVPYTLSTYDFNYEVLYPTVRMQILTPTDLHASSSGLNAKGVTTINQQTYFQYEGNQLLKGNEVHLELEGLPVLTTTPIADTSSSATLSPLIYWTILIVLILLVIVLITFLISRLMRSSATRTPTKTPQRRSSQPKEEPVGTDVSRPKADSTSTKAKTVGTDLSSPQADAPKPKTKTVGTDLSSPKSDSTDTVQPVKAEEKPAPKRKTTSSTGTGTTTQKKTTKTEATPEKSAASKEIEAQESGEGFDATAFKKILNPYTPREQEEEADKSK